MKINTLLAAVAMFGSDSWEDMYDRYEAMKIIDNCDDENVSRETTKTSCESNEDDE